MRKSVSMIIAAGLGLLPAAALAQGIPDRPPSDQERAAIELVLSSNGLVSWDDIELDDGRRWEVDDARLADRRSGGV